MQIKLLSAVLMCLLLVANAMAADEKPLEFKLNSITDNTPDKKDIKIIVKDQKNGVFVMAAGGWSGQFPKTSKLIRDMMVAKGIKVTEDPATADVGLQFANITGFSLGDIETQTNTIDGGKIGVGIGAVLGGGIFGAVGLLGSKADKPVSAMMSVISADKPTITGRNKIDGENKFGIFSVIQYQANKEGADVSTAVFVAYVDDFINKHFVFDTSAVVPGSAAVSTPVAASAVAPAATLVSSEVK
jgi:hypothetical protein